MTTRKLLLVDDEENILKALRRVLRKDGYEILMARSGEQGMDLLKDHAVGVIITDQRMPQMTGTQFLSQVRERYPDTMRIVLSGYTELESVTDAINRGHIYKFLTKPWEDDLLRSNIQEAFESYELRQENLRLARELRTANEELSRFNKELGHRVEVKNRELLIQMRVLEVSREVLEQLPIAVLGIADDNMVAVANQQAHALLEQMPGAILGRQADAVLPACLYDVWSRFNADGGAPLQELVKTESGATLVLRCSRMGASSSSQGAVMVLARE